MARMTETPAALIIQVVVLAVILFALHGLHDT